MVGGDEPHLAGQVEIEIEDASAFAEAGLVVHESVRRHPAPGMGTVDAVELAVRSRHGSDGVRTSFYSMFAGGGSQQASADPRGPRSGGYAQRLPYGLLQQAGIERLAQETCVEKHHPLAHVVAGAV